MKFKPLNSAVVIYVMTQDENARQVILQMVENELGEKFLKQTIPSDIQGHAIESFIPEKHIQLMLSDILKDKLMEYPISLDLEGNKVE